MNSKYIKALLLNLGISAAAIIAYSPGLLFLRPTDISILRAGFSILTGIGLTGAFGYGNYKLLVEQPKKENYSKTNVKDMSQAKEILQAYKNGKYFSGIANTTIDQLSRLEKSIARVKNEISRKFDPGTMTWQKYDSVIEEANEIALDNIIAMANRMQLFSDDEYARLQNYKDDNIPDNIQIQQIALYKQNMELITSAIGVNENLILGLDTLAVELSKPGKEDSSLIDEIQTLTQEVKYYI